MHFGFGDLDDECNTLDARFVILELRVANFRFVDLWISSGDLFLASGSVDLGFGVRDVYFGISIFEI